MLVKSNILKCVQNKIKFRLRKPAVTVCGLPAGYDDSLAAMGGVAVSEIHNSETLVSSRSLDLCVKRLYSLRIMVHEFYKLHHIKQEMMTRKYTIMLLLICKKTLVKYTREEVLGGTHIY